MTINGSLQWKLHLYGKPPKQSLQCQFKTQIRRNHQSQNKTMTNKYRQYTQYSDNNNNDDANAYVGINSFSNR